MANMKIIRVADYTLTPGARYPEDGPYSGQEYREMHLVPAFTAAVANGDILVVDMDGPHGYATSFLEEAFGGLARAFGAQIVLQHLRVKCQQIPRLRQEIRQYISDVEQ